MISQNDSVARDLFGALSASMLNLEDSAAIDCALHAVLEGGSAFESMVLSSAPSVEGRDPDIKVQPLWAYRVQPAAFGFDDCYPAGLVCVRLSAYAGPEFFTKSADVYVIFGAVPLPERVRTEFDMALAASAYMLAPGAVQFHPGDAVTLESEEECMTTLLNQTLLLRWDLLRTDDRALTAEGAALYGTWMALSRALDKLLLRAALDALSEERRLLRTADDLEDEED